MKVGHIPDSPLPIQITYEPIYDRFSNTVGKGDFVLYRGKKFFELGIVLKAQRERQAGLYLVHQQNHITLLKYPPYYYNEQNRSRPVVFNNKGKDIKNRIHRSILSIVGLLTYIMQFPAIMRSIPQGVMDEFLRHYNEAKEIPDTREDLYREFGF